MTHGGVYFLEPANKERKRILLDGPLRRAGLSLWACYAMLCPTQGTAQNDGWARAVVVRRSLEPTRPKVRNPKPVHPSLFSLASSSAAAATQRPPLPPLDADAVLPPGPRLTSHDPCRLGAVLHDVEMNSVSVAYTSCCAIPVGLVLTVNLSICYIRSEIISCA